MEEIIFKKQNKIGILTINRPKKRNSISPNMFLKIESLINEISRTDEVRALVIQGSGEKIFSSGYDIASIPTQKKEVVELLNEKNPLERGLQSIINYPYPVIAMLNGHAIGAGCELSLCCDIRVARDDIRMGMPPAKLGVLYLPNGLKRFVETIGFPATKELFFTGKYFEKQKLMQLNLVNYLVPKAELKKFTFDLANEIASNAPLSIKGTKKILNNLTNSIDVKKKTIIEAEELLFQAYTSADLKEGQKAFVEKRKPKFEGK